MYLFHSGSLQLHIMVAPTLNFIAGRGLRLGVAFDNQPLQILDVLEDSSQRAWEESVKDNVRILTSTHMLAEPGQHSLKLSMVDPGIVIQKLVLDCGGLKPSYLGPPESPRIGR